MNSTDISSQDQTESPNDAFPRVLPAIVAVGATLTFWMSIVRFLITVITTLIAQIVPNYEFDGLYLLLNGLDFWAVPAIYILGIFLLSLVQEESGAKSSFKLSWMLFLMFWTWSIVVMFEKNPDSIPPSVIWITNVVGLAFNLALYWGCLRLSKFCKDFQMTRWSLGALLFGSCSYLITAFCDGCDLLGGELISTLPEQQYQIFVQVYAWLFYIHWAVWFPLVYCICRVLWRIVAHAEIEAQKNIQKPLSPMPTSKADE
jgi:hypothetical protein